MLVTIAENHYNSASAAGGIKGTLTKLGVFGYLARLTELSERLLGYKMDDGPKEYIVTVGVPQGSVLGSRSGT